MLIFLLTVVVIVFVVVVIVFALYSSCIVCPSLCSFVRCVLFEGDVFFCVLCLIVVPLPPGKNPFAVEGNR
jgi:hypothetical protein